MCDATACYYHQVKSLADRLEFQAHLESKDLWYDVPLIPVLTL